MQNHVDFGAISGRFTPRNRQVVLLKARRRGANAPKKARNLKEKSTQTAGCFTWNIA